MSFQHTEAVPASNVPRTLTSQLTQLVKDLAPHRAAVYWSDMLLSIFLFWGMFAVLIDPRVGSLGKEAAFVITVLALCRAATFMHEIVHLPNNALPGFRWVWNMLCGIPILLPSFLYYSHLDHHSTRLYATVRDPEYLPFGSRAFRSWCILVLSTLLSPLTLWIRFALLVPLGWLLPTVRRWVDVHLSSVVIHPYYRAEMPCRARHRQERRIIEPAVTLYVWFVMVLSASGNLSADIIVKFVEIAMSVLLVNAFRTRYAHSYVYDGQSVGHTEQIEDSATLNDRPWLAVVVPLGLRFHALHHLFPYLPYHALESAHQRLAKSTEPAAEIYRKTWRRRDI